MPALVFNLTRDQFQSKKRELMDAGVSFDDPGQDSGKAHFKGVTVQYDFNGDDSITMSVVHRPFLASMYGIEATIKAWFEKP